MYKQDLLTIRYCSNCDLYCRWRPVSGDGCMIRRITEREAWRLMGFSDEDFDKAKAAGVSNTQLDKQAGNSIVVNVLMAIFKEMIKEDTI